MSKSQPTDEYDYEYIHLNKCYILTSESSALNLYGLTRDFKSHLSYSILHL